MRHVHSLMWSTTALTMVAAASPGFAQTPPNPNATAQTNPAQPAQNADAPQSPATSAATENTIVVTGQRRALQSARNVKRNSDQIVDSIVAADIGKLPDIAVSDTAARIPGIQVTRERGEANLVLLRGLDRAFYTTTYNSREIFTAETRSVALQDFPSGAIAALEAFKTSTADLIEPGIAGLINVRSRRPFDFKGFEIDGSVWALHPRQAHGWYPNGNILVTDRWKVGDEGEFGALLNFSYTRLHYLDSIISNAYFVAPFANGTRSPDWPFIEYNEATRTRPSLNGAIQYRVNPDLEFYVEGLWQGFRHEIQDRHFEQPIWGGQTYTNIVTQPDSNLAESGTVFNPRRGEGWQGGTYNKTDTYQFAAGGRYDTGPLRITADVARTDSTFTGSTESVDYRLCPSLPGNNDPFNCGQTVDFVIGAPGTVPSFNLVGFDPSNPNNYAFRGLFEENQQAKGKDWQARLDFDYQTGLTNLPKLQWGLRYVDRDASRFYGSRYSRDAPTRLAGFPDVYGTPISQVPLDYQMFSPGFIGADNPPFPTSWLAPTYSSIRDNIVALRQFVGFATTTPPAYDPTASFRANEKSLAAYLQANWAFDFGGMSADGQIGMRGVHANRDISGTQRTDTGSGLVFTPVDDRNSETYWLPNINGRIHFTRDLQMRLAWTKTRTRPQFQDLSPSISIGRSPDPSCAAPTLCETVGTGGNPNLKDLKSTNYDASLEYYFSPTGFAALAIFDHDFEGFVTPSSFTLGSEGGFPLRVFAPINSGKGHVRGFEAQVNTFFDFFGGPEWIKWFGIQANATYLNHGANFPRPITVPTCAFNNPDACTRLTNDPSSQINRPLLNVSRWSYNLIGMFEHGPVSVRLAYNKRSPYWADWSERADFSSCCVTITTGPQAGGVIYQPYILRQKVHEPGRLDLSASYTFMDRLSIFGDWTNILSKPQKTDLVRMDPTGTVFDPSSSKKVSFAWRGRYTERIVSLGVRFRFGGEEAAAAAPYVPPPPPPPVAAPVPEAAPPPPPPPAPTERGERGG